MTKKALYTEMFDLVSNNLYYNDENICEKKAQNPIIFKNHIPSQNLILSNIFGRNLSNNSLIIPQPNKSESEYSKINRYSNQDFNTINTISNQNLNEYYKNSMDFDNNNINKKNSNFNSGFNNDNKLFIDNNNLINHSEFFINNSSKINKSNSFLPLMNDNMQLSYCDYFLKASANQDNYDSFNFNINNNIIQSDTDKKEKKPIKKITNKIRINNNNKNKGVNEDFDLFTYGHPQKIKYKSIKQILNIHKKLDHECRDDTFYLLHTIYKLQKIIKNISKEGRIKNNNKYEELKIFLRISF